MNTNTSLNNLKLSEKTIEFRDYLNEDYKQFESDGYLNFISASTGSGKTSYMLQRGLHRRTIIVSPFVDTIKNIQKENILHHFLNDPIVTDYYQCLCEGTYFNHRFKKKRNIICTPEKAYALIQKYRNGNFPELSKYHLVFDEVHLLIKSASLRYRNEAMEGIFQAIKQKNIFKTVTGFSATFNESDINYFTGLEYHKVNIVNKSQKPLEVEIKYVDDNITAAVQAYTEQIEGTSIIFNNNKKRNEALGEALNKPYMVVDSNHKNNKHCVELISTDTIPENIKVILGTSSIVEGLNITSDIETMQIQEQKCSAMTVVQFNGRGRKQNHKLVIWRKRNRENIKFVDTQKLKEEIYRISTSMIKKLNGFNRDFTDANLSIKNIQITQKAVLDGITSTVSGFLNCSIRINEKGLYQLNETAIAEYLHNIEIQNERDPAYFEKKLKSYGVTNIIHTHVVSDLKHVKSLQKEMRNTTKKINEEERCFKKTILQNCIALSAIDLKERSDKLSTINPKSKKEMIEMDLLYQVISLKHKNVCNDDIIQIIIDNKYEKALAAIEYTRNPIYYPFHKILKEEIQTRMEANKKSDVYLVRKNFNCFDKEEQLEMILRTEEKCKKLYSTYEFKLKKKFDKKTKTFTITSNKLKDYISALASITPVVLGTGRDRKRKIKITSFNPVWFKFNSNSE